MSQKTQISASPPPRKELSDTPVKLCSEIGRLFRARMRASDNPDGVMSQHGAHLVLSVLAIHEGINQRELVRYTHLRPPTISIILRRMEEEGIVERKSNPDDLRAVHVYLTEAGRLLDQQHIERIRKLDANAMRGLSEEEIAVLMQLLPKLRDNLLQDEEWAGREEK